MTETLSTNIVTIIIALIAAMVALFQVKLNIISDARVKWIESLREALSQYCMEVELYSLTKGNFIYEGKGKTGLELENILNKYYPSLTDSGNKVLKLQSKVMLYLNSNNKKHKEIEDLLRQNSLLIHDTNADHREKIQKNIQQVIVLAKDIFKTEWKKSKRLFRI